MRKNYLIVFVCCIIFSNLSCNHNYWLLKKHEKFSNEIAELLSPKYFSTKESRKQYAVADVINSKDPIFILLKKNGIISEESFFLYSNPNCISLVTRKSKNNLGSFSDILITRNENTEDFLCGITSRYSLNSDENAESLVIKCYNLAGYMTLATVSTEY